jgi:hypothetical protein
MSVTGNRQPVTAKPYTVTEPETGTVTASGKRFGS